MISELNLLELMLDGGNAVTFKKKDKMYTLTMSGYTNTHLTVGECIVGMLSSQRPGFDESCIDEYKNGS